MIIYEENTTKALDAILKDCEKHEREYQQHRLKTEMKEIERLQGQNIIDALFPGLSVKQLAMIFVLIISLYLADLKQVKNNG